MIEYYGLRRVSPYLGVIQVVDTGLVRAYSTTGDQWIPRRVYDSERFWSDTENEALHAAFEVLPKHALVHALQHRPPIPFPMDDRYELWLLHKESRLPLALLKTCRWERDIAPVTDPNWQPFMPGEALFAMPDLDSPGRRWFSDPIRCQSDLANLVNSVAKPQPSAQWFKREADGSGAGGEGLRIGADLLGRTLPASAFPELLVDESVWPRSLDERLIKGFHGWLAPMLLAHQRLSSETRQRLEEATCRAPARLVDSYPMIPEIIDQDALEVAMVASKLMRSA